jgi:transketolase
MKNKGLAYPEPQEYQTLEEGSWSLLQNRIPAFVAGEELAELARENPNVVVLSADLKFSNRTYEFAEAFPDRFFNVGVAEQNMVCVASGMATCGKIPYVSTFASFIGLLCAEQLRTAVAYTYQPVRILAHHSGFTLGFYGTSHHALEDIGIIRTIADLPCVCATDANMLRAILRFSLDYDGPLYIRMGRGRDPEVYKDVPDFKLGKGFELRQGNNLALIATGSEVSPALEAAEILSKKGISVRVIDMASVCPLDTELVMKAANECQAVMTVEEHNITGGLGSAVAEALADHKIAVPFLRHGIKDEYVVVGPPAGLYSLYKLDGVGIAEVAGKFLSEQNL